MDYDKLSFYISIFLATLSIIISTIIAGYLYIIQERQKKDKIESELKRMQEGKRSFSKQRLYNKDLHIIKNAYESNFNYIYIFGINALGVLHKGRELIIQYLNNRVGSEKHVFILLLNPEGDQLIRRAIVESNLNQNDTVRFNYVFRVMNQIIVNNQFRTQIQTNNQFGITINDIALFERIRTNYLRLISEYHASIDIINNIRSNISNPDLIRYQHHNETPRYSFTASCNRNTNHEVVNGITWINQYKEIGRGLEGCQFVVDYEMPGQSLLYQIYVLSIFQQQERYHEYQQLWEY